jgi:hypothetical protein
MQMRAIVNNKKPAEAGSLCMFADRLAAHGTSAENAETRNADTE